MPQTAQPMTQPMILPDQDVQTRPEDNLDPGYLVICWDDPVNLMDYVTHVFQTVFGWNKEKAERHMLEVQQIVQCSILTPFAWSRRAEAAQTWRDHRGKIIVIGLLGPLGYVLILTAMTFTPVSYIAPAREISILVGTFFGAKLLKEADSRRRLLAASGMVGGIVALAFG